MEAGAQRAWRGLRVAPSDLALGLQGQDRRVGSLIPGLEGQTQTLRGRLWQH